MAEAPAEVPESQAEGAIKSSYDDIKKTLRLPYVPDLMRALAVYPHYLQLAWMALKPNAQTVFFERQSDALRRTATELTSRFPHPQSPVGVPPQALATLWYAAPKELLAAAALCTATSGQQPRLRALGPDDKRQAPSGPPVSAAAPPLSPAATSDENSALVNEIVAAAGGLLPPEYALLAASPESLPSAWKSLKALSQDLEYRRLQRTVSAAVEEAVTALPFRMDISTHVLRHSGLNESQIDDVRNVLQRYNRSSRQSLLNLALLSGSSGESPFPLPGP